MEQEQVKLLNVLRRIARAARYASWTRSDPQAARFCVTQYNRILARLTELEPSLKDLFTPMPEDASPEVTRMAARELLAYFEVDDPDFAWGYAKAFSFGCHPRHRRVKCVPISVSCE
jgi:hypothetical protein